MMNIPKTITCFCEFKFLNINIARRKHGVLTLENWIYISLHLSSFSMNFKPHDWILTSSTVVYMLLVLPFGTTSAMVKSSTNFHNSTPTASRSLIISANSQAPSFVP